MSANEPATTLRLRFLRDDERASVVGRIARTALRQEDPRMTTFFASLGASTPTELEGLLDDMLSDVGQRRELVNAMRHIGGALRGDRFEPDSARERMLDIMMISDNFAEGPAKVSHLRRVHHVGPEATSEQGRGVVPLVLRHEGRSLGNRRLFLGNLRLFEPAVAFVDTSDGELEWRQLPIVAVRATAADPRLFAKADEAMTAATDAALEDDYGLRAKPEGSLEGLDPTLLRSASRAPLLVGRREGPADGPTIVVQAAPPPDRRQEAGVMSGFQAAALRKGATIDTLRLPGALPSLEVAVAAARERHSRGLSAEVERTPVPTAPALAAGPRPGS